MIQQRKPLCSTWSGLGSLNSRTSTRPCQGFAVFGQPWDFWKHRCLHSLLATLGTFLTWHQKQMRVLVRDSYFFEPSKSPKRAFLATWAGLCLKSRSVLNLISHRDGIQSEIKRHCWTLVKQEYFFSGINNADRHYEIYSMTQWQIETRKIVSSLSSVKHEPLRLKCPAQQSWGNVYPSPSPCPEFTVQTWSFAN